MKQRILIAGYGYLGSQVAKQLAASGCFLEQDSIHLLSRRASEKLEKDRVDRSTIFSPIDCDLCEKQSLKSQLRRHLFDGAATRDRKDIVVYCVAPGKRASDYKEEAYRRTYITGLENLRDVFSSVGGKIPKLIYVSSTGVYGYDDGRIVSDDTPRRAARATAEVLIEAENRALAAWPRSIVLRLSGIYGPARLHIERYLRYARDIAEVAIEEAGTSLTGAKQAPDEYAPFVDGWGSWTNRIHVQDAAAIIAALATSDRYCSLVDQWPDRSMIVSDSRPVQRVVLAQWLAKQTASIPKNADVYEKPAQKPISAYSNKESRIGGRNKYLVASRLQSLGLKLAYPDYLAGYTDEFATSTA